MILYGMISGMIFVEIISPKCIDFIENMEKEQNHNHLGHVIYVNSTTDPSPEL